MQIMNVDWVNNVKLITVPVLSEFQSKSFKQFKQWTTGLQMLKDVNVNYAQDLNKVSKEFKNKLQEGHLDYRLKDNIGNFCKVLESLSKAVLSVWQDYSTSVNPYHEYSSFTDAKEKAIEKKRQKSAKLHEDMKQKLDIERKKYVKAYQDFNSCLERLPPSENEESISRIMKAVVNQSRSRMDVASTKYQSQHIKEMQRRKGFKEEMAKLRLEWIENEEKKINCLINTFEDTLKRMSRTSLKVNSENMDMFDECIAGFVHMDVEKVVQNRLKLKEKDYHFHEYKADDGIVTLERRVSTNHLVNKTSMDNEDIRSFDWTLCHQEESTENPKDCRQKILDPPQKTMNTERIINQMKDSSPIEQSCGYYNRSKIIPRRNGFFEPENLPGFQKSP